MNTDFSRPSKEAIREMPLFRGLPMGQIISVVNRAELVAAKKILAGVKELGFDTESRPTFRKGEKSRGPHVIQLATQKHAVLFTPQFLPGVEFVLNILKNDTVTKYGFGLSGDKSLFRTKFNVEVTGTVDLSIVARRSFGFKQNVGARAAIAILFNQRLTKSAQRSNWANHPLEPNQVKYAADDAYAGLCVANELKKLGLMGREILK